MGRVYLARRRGADGIWFLGDAGGFGPLPDRTVEALRTLWNEAFTEALDGRNARVTNGVEQVLGRPARDFADFARHAAATGAWDLRTQTINF